MKENFYVIWMNKKKERQLPGLRDGACVEVVILRRACCLSGAFRTSYTQKCVSCKKCLLPEWGIQKKCVCVCVRMRLHLSDSSSKFRVVQRQGLPNF